MFRKGVPDLQIISSATLEVNFSTRQMFADLPYSKALALRSDLTLPIGDLSERQHSIFRSSARRMLLWRSSNSRILTLLMSLLRCIEEFQNRFYQTWLTIGGFCGIINTEARNGGYKMTQIFANTSRMLEIFNVMNWQSAYVNVVILSPPFGNFYTINHRSTQLSRVLIRIKIH